MSNSAWTWFLHGTGGLGGFNWECWAGFNWECWAASPSLCITTHLTQSSDPSAELPGWSFMPAPPFATQRPSQPWHILNPLEIPSEHSARALWPLLSPVLLAHMPTDLPCVVTDCTNNIAEEAKYLVGVGRADCTGPVAQVPLVSGGNSTWGW